ncbi:hypothetical protein [Flavobacterium aquidurense]|uniref:hypothetical protein n=1 Tax=Flavobacterium aquidurense TaxID=362413 RepID=UPI003716E8EA
MNEENYKFTAKTVTESTESFSRFQQEILRSEMLISYLDVANTLVLKNDVEAKRCLTNIYDHAFNSEIAKKSLTENLDHYLNLRFYEIHLSSMVYVNTIDNFSTYLKDILSEVVFAKPQILKSQESEKLDFILEYESMDDLINAIASKKLEELFYKGIEDIGKFFKSRLGIDIFKTDKEKETINLHVKQRNLTVHNRRRISKDFAKQFPNLEFKIGEYLNFDFRYVSTLNLYLFNFVATIDEEISQKFKLKKISAGT